MCTSQKTMKTSVAEFRRPEELLEDLLEEQQECRRLNSAATSSNNNTATDMDNNNHLLVERNVEDWALTQINVEDTRVQTLHDEVQRLQVLQSYNIAGVHGVPSIDRLVQMGTSIFDMPLCVVSLVDLRRLWFLSSQGFGDLREIPRKDTLCSHAVCNMKDILIVQDCEHDERFRELFTVTGPPHLRFYAGACIISPEGYNIGNFCVLDTKPHPEGLTPTQILTLKDLAATTMQLLVDRRYRQEMETKQKPLIANTAHELMTPLAGIHVSLTALTHDTDLAVLLDDGQQEMLQLASSCSNLMTRICRSMIDTVRGSSSSSSKDSDEENNVEGKLMRVSDLATSLNQIIRPIPKHVPVLFQVDSNAALASVLDDLAIFRVTLACLSIACARTQQGSIVLKINYCQQDGSLLFECQDTAETISVMDQQALFHAANDSNNNNNNNNNNSGSHLPSSSDAATAAAAGSLPVLSDSRLMGYHSAASLLDSLGGNYGYRPSNSHQQGGVSVSGHGGVFWFSIPKPLVKCHKSLTDIPLGQLQSNTNTKSESKSQLLELKKSVLGIPTKNKDQGNTKAKSKNKTCTRIPLMSRRYGSLPTNLHYHASSRYGNNSITPAFVVPQKNATFRTTTTTRPLLSPILHIATNRADDLIPRNGTEKHAHSGGAVVLAPVARNPKSETSQGATPTRREGTHESEQEDIQSWGKKALVIDDSLVIRKGLSRLLTKNGYQVETAVDGQEGLEAMKQTMFDFVLCDFLMPVMDGLDCVKQFREWERKHRPGFYQCIFGISAHADTKDLEKGIQLGMDQYFTKPIPLQVIKDLPHSASVVRTEKKYHIDKALVAPPNPGAFSSLGSPHSSPKPDKLTPINGAAQEIHASVQQNKVRGNDPSSKVLQSTLLGENDSRPSCLIASSIGPNDNGSIQALEDKGWRCIQVSSSGDALRFLKERNWDAVIVDSHLSPLIGAETIALFRKWEQTSRMNRQSNVFLEFSLDSSHLFGPGYCYDIQAPPGFDGVIQRERLWDDFHVQVKTENDHDRHSGVGSVLSIITH